MDKIQAIIEYLKQSTEHFVWIMYNRNYLTGNSGQNIYLKDIPKEDLKLFLEQKIGGNTTDKTFEFVVEHRKVNGNGHMKNTQYRDLRIILESPYANTMPMEATPVQHNYPVQYQQPAPVQQIPQQQFFGMGSPGVPQFGLGAAEFLDLKSNSRELERVKEINSDLKQENQLLKLEVKNLEIEKTDLTAKLSVAEQKKEMAVMMAQLDKKSFLDSPAFQAIIEQAPQILAGIAQAKGGGAMLPTGLSGTSEYQGVSETKKQFMDYMAGDNVTDQQVNHLASLLVYMSNSDFVNDLNLIIKKHGNTTN